MSIDVRRLQVLRQVALRGTIAAAAEALAFTPSAVSQQLAALERETGAELLERSGRSVRLTDAGRVLVEHAEAIGRELDHAESALQATLHQVVGTLCVGAFASVTTAVLGPAVANLSRQHPDLSVTIHDVDPGASLRDLRLGELDFVVSHEYDHMFRPAEPGLDRRLLFEEPMFAVTPPHRFPGAAPVDLADLAAEHFAAAPIASDCGKAVREACRAVGFEADVRYNFAEFPVQLQLVRAGLAIAILPALALASDTGGCAIHPLAAGGFSRRIFTACRQGSSTRPSIVALRSSVSAQAASVAARIAAA